MENTMRVVGEDVPVLQRNAEGRSLDQSYRTKSGRTGRIVCIPSGHWLPFKESFGVASVD
jgi:hypothetical protein